MTRKWQWMAFVGAPGIVLACSTGTSGVPQQEAGTDSGGTRFGESSCAACVKQTCASSVASCSNSPECATYLSCLNACGVGADGNVDPSCASACPRGSSSTALEAEQQLSDCRTQGLGRACVACGVDAGSGNPLIHQTCPTGTDPNACARCEDTNCCHTYDACRVDSQCQAYKLCLKGCLVPGPDGGVDAGTQTCELFCDSQYPKGVGLWAQRQTCYLVHCLNECTTGVPDSCQACLVSKCTEQYANLFGTEDGLLESDCIQSCGANKGCIEACVAKYPAAKPAYDALKACSTAFCKCGS